MVIIKKCSADFILRYGRRFKRRCDFYLVIISRLIIVINLFVWIFWLYIQKYTMYSYLLVKTYWHLKVMQSVFKKAFPFPDYSSFQKNKKINLLIIVELFRLYLLFFDQSYVYVSNKNGKISRSHNDNLETLRIYIWLNSTCMHLAISSLIMYLPIFFFSCRWLK